MTLSFSKSPNQLFSQIFNSPRFLDTDSTSNLDNECSLDSLVNDCDKQLAKEGDTYAEGGDTFVEEEEGDTYEVDFDKLECATFSPNQVLHWPPTRE